MTDAPPSECTRDVPATESTLSRRNLLKSGITASIGSALGVSTSGTVSGDALQTNTLRVTADNTTTITANPNRVYEGIVWEATGRLIIEDGAGIILSDAV